MSHSQSNEIKRPENVVRLHIDGVKTAVNTLRDQETARGLSLICPFPALEVDIPVRFGEKSQLSTGAIHRIGVEDDPQTGLPRLRLSIRTRETRPTVVAKTSESLLRSVQRKASAEATGEVSVPAAPKPSGMRPADGSWADFLTEISTPEERGDESYSMHGASDRDEDEPKWASGAEVPLPEELAGRLITRRRYRMVRHVAGAFVLGMLAASLYLFDRAGVVSFSNIKDRIVAAVFGESEETSAESSALVSVDPAPEVTPEQVSGVSEEAPSLASATPQPAALNEKALSAAPMDAAYTPGPNPLTEALDIAPAAAAAKTPETEIENAGAAEPETSVAENMPGAEEEAASAEGDVTLLLPTRWPVEYATAYRVREPNGVVVDVPGGLVKREGWLEDGKANPMVRSIKSIQRESGARFIVYVNGELPRFITTPKTNGVSLRLYLEGDDMKTAAVASLQ